MNTPPSNPRTAPPAARKRLTADQRQQRLVVGGAAAVVLLVAVAIYAYFTAADRPAGPPRLNQPPVTIARFIGTPQFDQLPYDRKRLYMKELSGQRKELKAQFAAKQLTREEWENTLSVLWLGKQFKHMDHYNSLGPYDRKAYLDELINDDIQDDAEDDLKPKDTPKKDKDKIKAIVARFPEAERRAYDTYRRVLKAREKDREREAKAIAKAAASKPTTRPTTR